MTEPEQPMYPVEADVLRYKLNKVAPYFADVNYRLRPRPQEGLGTFSVDEKFNWFYGDEVPFTPEEQVAVLFHEINHLIRNHFERTGDRDKKQFNVAGDREINDWFPNSMKPPEKGVGSKRYGMDDCNLPDDELAEWYYERLDQFELHAREDATAMDPGVGKCVTHPGCDNQDVEHTTSGAPDWNVLKKGKMHVPVCGGASGNDDGDPDTGDGGQGVSKVEADAIRTNVAEKIRDEQSRGRGDLPGSLVNWAEEFLNPTIHWTKLLRKAARKASTIIAGDTTQTFTKPPRRSPPGIILPKKVARKTIAAFYIDTSGSVSDEEIHQSVAEVKGALRTSLADLTVSFVDAEVYTSHKVVGRKVVTDQLQRGGTDMRKCFEHAVQMRPRPNLCIVMTDGETPWPLDRPRDMRTIVVLTQTPSNTYPVPEWVWKVITMDPKHRQ
jgi:Uncharacterized protein conserved in bacteria